MKSPILMRVWRDNKKPAEQWSEAEKDESGMASPYIKRVRPIHIKPCTNKGELKCPKSSTNGAGPVLVIPDADEIDPGRRDFCSSRRESSVTKSDASNKKPVHSIPYISKVLPARKNVCVSRSSPKLTESNTDGKVPNWANP